MYNFGISDTVSANDSPSLTYLLPSISCSVIICFDEDVSFHQINRTSGYVDIVVDDSSDTI